MDARMQWTAVLVAVATLVFISCGPAEPSGNVTRGPAGSEAIEVTIEDGAFQPDHLRVDPGDPVRIEITNSDNAPHDFAIPAIRLNTGILDEGDVATAEINIEQEELEFVCTLHEDMRGTIVGG